MKGYQKLGDLNPKPDQDGTGEEGDTVPLVQRHPKADTFISFQPSLVMKPMNPWDYATVSWLTPMILKGSAVALEFTDLPGLRSIGLAHYVKDFVAPYQQAVSERIRENRQQLKQTPIQSPLWYLWKAIGLRWSIACLTDFLVVGIDLFTPILVQNMIDYMSRLDSSKLLIQSPWALTFLIFGLTILRVVLATASDQEIMTVQFQVKTALTNLIYEKALKLSYKASLDVSEGRILQMVTVDVYNVFLTVWRSFETALTLIQIVAIIVLLDFLTGTTVVSAIVALSASVVIVIALVPVLEIFQNRILHAGDERIRMLREALLGIKIIKLRTIDVYFQNVINAVRDQQMKALVVFLSVLGFLAFILTIVPIGLPIFLLEPYVNVFGARIDASIVFPALAYYRMLYVPLRQLPQDAMVMVQGVTSWLRIRQFLTADEFVSDVNYIFDVASDSAIKIKDATFMWETPDSHESEDMQRRVPVFRNLSLNIKKGSFVAIVGAVGSGKSSIIAALTNDLRCLDGEVTVNGKVALCRQQPWLMSKTIEENILFGLPLARSKLDATINACCLRTDINQLENGLKTLVGDNSVTLSGGQRARVALARAVYYNADIYLLDDPLAALDSHASRMVFNNCFKGILKSKTRVLITHQLQYLPEVDHIIVLGNHRVLEEGSFSELMASEGHLAKIMKDFKFTDSTEEEDKLKHSSMIDSPFPSLKPRAKDEKDNLIADEDRERGTVKLDVLYQFIKHSGGGLLFSLMIFLFVLYMLSDIWVGIWLTWWASDQYSQMSNYTYFLVFFGTTIGGIGAIGIAIVILFYQNVKACRHFHERAIEGLMHAPMSFFDSQPIGRILNRLSKDLQDLDSNLWYHSLNSYLQTARTLGVVILVGYLAPITLLIFVLLGLAYYWVMNLYRSSMRELKRLRSVHMSPLSAHISESLAGLATLRIFKAEARCIRVQRRLIDEANVPAFIQENTAIWLGFRIGIFASVLVLCLCVMGILAPSSANAIGFSISIIMSFSDSVRILIFSFALFEAAMVSVERLDHYCRELPVEPPRYYDTDPPPFEWPRKGEIEFQMLVARYESRKNPVLKNVSMKIRPGEKVGIVGRTGSGKSTLLTVLFRLIEPFSGKILIDGLDITKLGLHTLRGRLEIISQDPVLFSGTLRSNLDTETKFTDQQLWDALEMVGMRKFVQSLPGKLDAIVSDNGDNFSVGQRQLLTLARAICTHPKILIMDEASSAIDSTADALLQKAIRTHFHSTTVLSIAHRLRTIADFDKVAVLNGGELVEFDMPYTLLQKQNGVFRRLVFATGAANKDLLTEIARAHYLEKGGTEEGGLLDL